MASVAVFTSWDREGADALAGLLRELGIAAAAVPEEDEGAPGAMVWRVRVPEAQARRVRALIEDVMPP
jgi:hypothetical protein